MPIDRSFGLGANEIVSTDQERPRRIRAGAHVKSENIVGSAIVSEILRTTKPAFRDAVPRIGGFIRRINVCKPERHGASNQDLGPQYEELL
jgi:hypothetical protein